MAKYTRHDQRNKKRNKHKSQSKAGQVTKARRVGKDTIEREVA
jgi:hypothetical protein